MGNSEDGKSCKPEKPSSPALDQSNLHVYPDWAAMQAYYGPRVAVPAYFNSAVAPGHTPHPYMWGPQPMVPPYGAPYAAIYAHGGVYAHPGVPIGSHPPGHVMATSAAVSQAMDGASLSLDASAKSSGNTDRGMMNKLKEFEGLAMSLGNGSADNVEGGTDNGHSQSGETDGSTDGSDTNGAGVSERSKKRSRGTTPDNSGDDKSHSQRCQPTREVNDDDEKSIVAVSSGKVAERVMGTVLSPSMTTLEMRNPASAHVKVSPSSSPLSPALPNETWLQNERELKREKRKQSNRESARRSRLRKQAEAEELAMRVQSLTAENMTLKSEINKLMENSEKLKLDNAALMERLKNEQLGQKEQVSLGKIDDKRLQPVGTVNLLARVNNSSSLDRTNEEGEVYENNSSGAKLHQLLDTSPRTDAVAAG
ncbi:transcriptional activator TAF-1-like isoform X2 [Lycium ferocissimum]|uniref:transcriptional activator TAF-1-like isoform X2 n=1 Tax=Lycium ferocissimum TaxID=112874 RepID=UPI002815AD4D|nr:transcriptional activator TAF-1-like isoform X2 [Lycium ferocissimum]